MYQPYQRNIRCMRSRFVWPACYGKPGRSQPVTVRPVAEADSGARKARQLRERLAKDDRCQSFL